MLPDFKIYHKATSNQDNVVLAQRYSLDQWNRKQSDIDPYIHKQLNF